MPLVDRHRRCQLENPEFTPERQLIAVEDCGLREARGGTILDTSPRVVEVNPVSGIIERTIARLPPDIQLTSLNATSLNWILAGANSGDLGDRPLGDVVIHGEESG